VVLSGHPVDLGLLIVELKSNSEVPFVQYTPSPSPLTFANASPSRNRALADHFLVPIFLDPHSLLISGIIGQLTSALLLLFRLTSARLRLLNLTSALLLLLHHLCHS